LKGLLKLLLLTDACFIFAAGLFGPIYAIFVQRIGGDLLDAGWAWAAFTLTSGIVIFLLSGWEDRVVHYEQLIIGGYALRSIGIFCYLLISTPMQLLVVQVLIGLSLALSSPAYDALYSKSLEKGKEASQWGDWESMDFIVSAFAAIIGSAIAMAFGFATLFFIMFLISLAGVFVSIMLIPKFSHQFREFIAAKAGVFRR
jgi:hypothetical protein